MPSSSAASALLPDLTKHFIDDGTVQLLSLLGSGAHGKVYKAWDCDAKAHVAVKCMPTYEPGTRAAHAQASELELHQMLSGEPGVIRLIRHFVEDDLVFVVLELAAGGDLSVALFERQVFHNSLTLVKKTLGELIDAVERMHQRGVFHRDIKPQNILCEAAGTDLRLADFGLATRDEFSQRLGCGTRLYMSPESLNPTKDSYSARHSDLWALSVLFTIMVCERTPWESAEPSDPGFAAFCDDPEYLWDTLPVTQPTFLLLRRCFHQDPLQRPSLEEFRNAIADIECFTEPPRARGPLRPALPTGQWVISPLPNVAAEPFGTTPCSAALRRPIAPQIRFSSSLGSSSSSHSDSSIDAFTLTRCSTPPTSPASSPVEDLSACPREVTKPSSANKPYVPGAIVRQIELERVIFELAAHSDILTALRLAVVARRVQDWIEPIIYSRVIVTRDREQSQDAQPTYEARMSLSYRMNKSKKAPVLKKKEAPIPQFLRTLALRPAAFFAKHVQQLRVGRLADVELVAVLEACTGATELGWWACQLTDAVCTALARLPLTRLAVDHTFDFQFPQLAESNVISRLTHLDVTFIDSSWNISLPSFEPFTALTHLSVAYGSQLPTTLVAFDPLLDPARRPRLQILLLLSETMYFDQLTGVRPRHPDPRVVVMTPPIGGAWSTRWVHDAWPLAEEYMRDRRALAKAEREEREKAAVV
ncbi:kinase-like domain-containing protein [Roridomyces roridus]|uniref:Kinase-like domain-containing protein n=1 Tax=Roridomyces roridus TaxID=1738132 RepID=A0AAD7BYJ1_9AGAR|nr:kinase-like domain-containing protein [Roridomyces roridus]